MNLKKILAGATLAAALSVGTAGVAAAAEPPERREPSTEHVCAKAKQRVERLQAANTRLGEMKTKLGTARERAVAAGKTDVVARIDARLAKIEEHHGKVDARIDEIRDKVAGRCELPA